MIKKLEIEINVKKLPKYWITRNFRDTKIYFIDGDRGNNYPKKREFNIQGYCLFLSTKNVLPQGFDLSECLFIDEQKDKLLGKGKLKRGDIVFTTRGTVGNIALYTRDFSHDNIRINSGMVIIRNGDPEIDTYYLYLFLRSKIFKNQFKKMSSGSIQTQLPIDDFKNLSIILPPKKEQRSIAEILRYIDNKISLNNKINTELEQMTRMLFDYWFVQFDFPNIEDKPYKSSGGKMVYNKKLKRKIPERWRVENIGASCSIVDCLHSKKPENNLEDKKYYLLQLQNLRKDGLLDLTNKYYVTIEDYEKWTSRIEVNHNDILITNAGRVAAIVQIPIGIRAGIGRNLTAIRPINVCPTYLYLAFHGFDMLHQIRNNTDTGSFFSSLNVWGIKKLNILRPSKEVEKQFEKIIYPMRRMREINNIENEELIKIRDFLLPLLMNGQVKVN